MPRLMSVAYTEDAVRAKRKTVTRRAGWTALRPGTELDLCRKVLGRRKGDPLVRIARVCVIDVRRERLDQITDDDARREGFTDEDFTHPPWGGDGLYRLDAINTPALWFILFFTHHMGGTPEQEVTRIEWEYLPDPSHWHPHHTDLL